MRRERQRGSGLLDRRLPERPREGQRARPARDVHKAEVRTPTTSVQACPEVSGPSGKERASLVPSGKEAVVGVRRYLEQVDQDNALASVGVAVLVDDLV